MLVNKQQSTYISQVNAVNIAKTTGTKENTLNPSTDSTYVCSDCFDIHSMTICSKCGKWINTDERKENSDECIEC